MGLSGQQRKQLQFALIDAFPTTASLEQMLAFGLDKSLRAIAGEGSLQDIVFELIKTANSEGWIANLICAACNCNPGNSKLQTVAQNLIIKNSFTIYSRIQESLEEYGYFELHELGTGVSGVTYRAIKGNDKTHIVIKTIKIDLLHKIIKSDNQDLKEFTQAITSFKKEADILSKFKHRHIVLYYDHLTIPLNFLINNPHKKLDNSSYLVYDKKLLFLVMEYIEGQNLEQLLSRRDTPLQETEALGYIQQIGEALNLVHNKGVLHRDIKPQNIMVRETTNDAVLIDFGIAREFNPMITQTLTLGFTQGYAPPEQLEQRSKWGNYTDVYGLAATLYYLLTKVHPTHAFKRKSDSSSFVEPKKINSNISNTVNEAILWGMELESSKRPQTVQQWLAKLLSPVSALDTIAYNSRGDALELESSKRPQTVQQWFAKLLSFFFALDAIAYNRRGNAYYKKKDYDHAIAEYNQALKLDPSYVNAYYNRGWTYYGLKNYDRAIADFNQALKLDPNYVYAYNSRGNVYSDLKDYDRAIADFNQAIKLDPNDPDAYNNRGNAYLGKEDYEQAFADFNQAIKLNPNDANAYDSRCEAYRNSGDNDSAITDCNIALKLDPTITNSYYNRGLAYKNKGSLDLASEDFKKVLELNDDVELSQKAKQLLQELGR